MTPRSEDVVTALYRAVLGREPDAEGLASWAVAIDHGTPLVDVVRAFIDSPERALREGRSPKGPPVPAFYTSPQLVDPAGKLTIVDVGAQALDDEMDVHRPLINSGRTLVVGFEPLEGEVEARRGEGWVMLPHAVGDGATRTFHETVWDPTSSLYEPDLDVMADFVGLAEICAVRATRQVETVRLDDALAGVLDGPVDFLKLDVQGAECDVLRGAERTVDGVLAVHTEVEFHPIYRGQPRFGEVAAFMEERGFDLFDLTRLARYQYQGADPSHPGRRLIWADAVFIPGRDRLDALDETRTLRLGWIMHEVYEAVDFVAWLLGRFDRRAGTGHVGHYRDLLECQTP